jgi:hypothetical protein
MTIKVILQLVVELSLKGMFAREAMLLTRRRRASTLLFIVNPSSCTHLLQS